ncbi:hypothetical protein [Methylophaga thalassica]|uniref:Site-specific recombinase, phage integrase family n=1 Tax=Methylophaga aminisulfidivorans MP TaxID=1026882 RepID=F5T0R9_9GAMM|nr:hypothetical protein [Methylophaga aminisulfidivorans]EGL53883.1 site-specific recombinase, phage integrase family [Methylophaga aminisulfidivorans MP]
MNVQLVPYDTIGIAQHTSPDSLSTDVSTPDSNHVISRRRNGDILSVFADNVWDFSLYTSRPNARIYFESIFSEDHRVFERQSPLANSIIQDSKLIILNLWYRRQLSVNSVMALWIQIKYLARYALSSGIKFADVLGKTEFIECRLEGAESRYQEWVRLASLYNLIKHLSQLSHQVNDFNLIPSVDLTKLVAEQAQERVDEAIREKIQTPVIPIRLLSELIEQSTETCFKFMEVVTEVEKAWEHYEVTKERAEKGEIKFGKWRKSNATIARQVWKYIKETYPDIANLLEELQVDSIQELTNYISYIQKTSAAMISQFTGMRVSEVRAIPLNSYRRVTYGEEVICGFDSYTFKFAGNSPKKQFWVTADQAELYYQCALASARLIYRFYYSLNMDSVNQDKYPLFPNHSSRVDSETPIFVVNPRPFKEGWRASTNNTLRREAFVITNEDLEEMQSFNPWVDFSKKGIDVGKEFPFAWHMYRRSLVVYAARGGVSIPVIANQLKHPIEKMTVYYTDGSAYANNFVERGTNQNEGLFDFINELQEEVLTMKVDAICNDISDYEGILFGGAGATLQRQKNKGILPSIYEDRALTEKEVRSGRLSYRRTVVGGCSSIEPCDRVAFTSILPCIDCSDAIFNDDTAEIMADQIEVWKEEISIYGEKSPFSLQREKEISVVEQHLAARNNLIPVKEIIE